LQQWHFRFIKMSTHLVEANTPLFHLDECRRFIVDCMLAVGTPRPNAEALANILIEADYRGHYSHGMNRIEMYLSEAQNGICKVDASPEILKETPATAWVEGHGGLGVVVGTFGMDLAIEKAKAVGVGLVVCKGSNHYGIAGMYALQAMKKGLLGLSFTNTSPVVAPTRTKHAALGTNPLSLAAPGLNGDSFVLDMATSAVAMGKIEMKNRTNSAIPSQWLDPDTGALHPLGGDESNSSYKGYGLVVLVEILCGILSGGAYGPNIRVLGNFERMADLGHCFIAVDPKCFAPGFEERLSDLMESLRQMPPNDPDKPVLVAGDSERLHMKAVDEAGGIRYIQDQLDTCEKVAQDLNIRPLQPLAK
jgi:LDH2 family malate/lactate/ureidoglycolate dehydrogenase